MNWIEAIQGKARISCPFEYAALLLTEVMLLGIVSLRAGQKTPGTVDSLRRRQYARHQYDQRIGGIRDGSERVPPAQYAGHGS